MGCTIILALATTFGVTRAFVVNNAPLPMTTAPQGGSCIDTMEYCGLLDTSYYCSGSFKQWAMQSCQKTCNMCENTNYQPNHRPQTTQSPANCYFNGVYYTQGQSWDDDCDKTCTCTDAAAGLYTCRDVCLNWHAMPSVCHMEDAPTGLCCKQPKCPSNIIINIPKGYEKQYPGYRSTGAFAPVG